MKKLLSLGLAAMLAFGLATTSFAAEDTSGTTTTPTDSSTSEGKYPNMTEVKIKKVYKATNPDTVNPAEDFKLTVTKSEVKDGDARTAPEIKDSDITVVSYRQGEATTDGVTKEFVITLPEYENVGIYEYTLQEVAGKNAGVNYYGNTFLLRVTVIEQDGLIRVAAVHTQEDPEGKKLSTITNTYSAGKLDVSKTVTGNMGDSKKYFDFTVTLEGVAGKTYAKEYAVTGGSYSENPKTVEVKPGEVTTYTFKLKADETISIANLPYNVTYTVTEANYTDEGYVTSVGKVETNEAKGTIAEATQTAAFTNYKNNDEIDMGVTLNNMPYILVLAVLAAGVAVFVIRKRRED